MTPASSVVAWAEKQFPILKHAFSAMRLHRISLRVIADNVRAIRGYSACGFVEEGRERETVFIDGQWHEDILVGLLDAVKNRSNAARKTAERSEPAN